MTAAVAEIKRLICDFHLIDVRRIVEAVMKKHPDECDECTGFIGGTEKAIDQVMAAALDNLKTFIGDEIEKREIRPTKWPAADAAFGMPSVRDGHPSAMESFELLGISELWNSP